MKPVLVLFATREGHTRRIAEHVAATLRARDLTSDVEDANALPAGFELGAYAAAVLAASVHAGHHEREMVAFAKEHRETLEQVPTALLSVSLSEAGAENVSAAPAMREKAATEVEKAIQVFCTETGWHPRRVQPVAGALLYRQYGFVIRLIMRMIAKRSGNDTDASRDYEYTNWEAVDRFVDDLAKELVTA